MGRTLIIMSVGQGQALPLRSPHPCLKCSKTIEKITSFIGQEALSLRGNIITTQVFHG